MGPSRIMSTQSESECNLSIPITEPILSKIVATVLNSAVADVVFDQWRLLVLHLGIPRLRVAERIRPDMTVSLGLILAEVLTEWMMLRGAEATVQALIEIFEEKLKWKSIADDLRSCFQTFVDTRLESCKPTRLFTKPPPGVAQFLSPKNYSQIMLLKSDNVDRDCFRIHEAFPETCWRVELGYLSKHNCQLEKDVLVPVLPVNETNYTTTKESVLLYGRKCILVGSPEVLSTLRKILVS